MKKIAIFTPSIFTCGGEQRVVTVIANELAKRNKVTIFTCDKKRNKENIYGLSQKIAVKHYFPYGRNPVKSGLRFLERKKLKLFERYPFLIKIAYYSDGAVRKMHRTVKNEFDLVIAVSGNLSILLGYANSRRGIEHIYTIGWEHSSYEAYFETPNLYMWNRKEFFVESVSKLDSCVVLNEDIAEKYKTRLGISCDVIYNPRSFVSKEKSTLTNKQFIAVGRFVKAKGFDLLLEAFRLYAQMESEWKLVLVGEGPMLESLKKKAIDYGIHDRVIFTGYTKRVKELLLDSSIYILSSRWEGFPMCVTEAYEAGLPMVCYDIPAVLPLLKNREGIKVDAFDTKQLAEAMYQLAQNRELREDMGKNAIDMANSISVENIGKQWGMLFNKRENRGIKR